jgi:hypothetical protein
MRFREEMKSVGDGRGDGATDDVVTDDEGE